MEIQTPLRLDQRGINQEQVNIPLLQNIIQIIHNSEGITKNFPHEVPLEQSNTPETVAEGVWTVLKVPSVGYFTNA